MKKEPTLLYDIKSMPLGTNFEDLIRCFQQLRIVYWDSALGGNAPVIMDLSDNMTVIDISKDLTEETL